MEQLVRMERLQVQVRVQAVPGIRRSYTDDLPLSLLINIAPIGQIGPSDAS